MKIHALANQILQTENTLYNDYGCNVLLQYFYRNIESDEALKWEGTLVTQVCLAEGTTVFVKLDQVVDTVFQNMDVPADTDGSTALFDTYFCHRAPLVCAEELFYNSGATGQFEFQFNKRPGGNLGHLAIPTGISAEACDKHR
jgi:hypothetical protein